MSKYWSPLTRDPVSSAQFRQAFDDVESLTDVAIGQGIISGLGVSSSVGLSLTVSSGVAVFAGGHFSFGGASISLANNTTNHVYLVSSYQTPTRTYLAQLETNTSGIAPAGSIKLGTVVTSGGSVSATNFNSSGTRGINLLSLEQLSGMVPNLVSATGSYFPTAATGALIAAISQGVSSGAYLTNYEWGQVSGTYLTKSQFAETSGAFGSLSGSFATKLELLAASGSLNTRLVTVENTYVTRTLFNATSGTVAQLQSQTGTYLLKASSGMFATSGAVAALAAAVSLMYLKTEFAAVSGSLFTKAEFAATSGAMYLRSEFAAVSGQFVGIQTLRSVSGNLIPWTSSGAFASSGLVARVEYLESITGSGGGGGGNFSLNSITGDVTLAGSGGISLVQIGQDIYLYSPTGSMSFSDFNSISGSYLLRSEYAATSGSGGGIGAAVLSLNGASGDITLVASGGTVIQRSGTNINIFSPTGSSSSVDLSPYLLQSVYAQSSGTTFILPMLLGYTPAASGFDSLEIPVPYLQSNGGNIPVTFQLQRIVATCTVPGSAMAMTIYKAASGTAMSTANPVGSITLPISTYQADNTSGLGTFTSGERLRLFTNTLGTPTNLTVTLEFSPLQSVGYTPTVNATGPLVANLNTPVLSGFGWVNQSGSVAVNSAAGIRMEVVPLATESYRMLINNGASGSAVSGNWRISGLFLTDFTRVNYEHVGILLRQTSNSRIMSLGLTHDATSCFSEIRKMTTETSFSASASIANLGQVGSVFFKIECVSNTLFFYRSVDGQNWRLLFSEAVGTFVTPNQVGFFANARNSGSNALMTTCRHFLFEYI